MKERKKKIKEYFMSLNENINRYNEQSWWLFYDDINSKVYK